MDQIESVQRSSFDVPRVAGLRSAQEVQKRDSNGRVGKNSRSEIQVEVRLGHLVSSTSTVTEDTSLVLTFRLSIPPPLTLNLSHSAGGKVMRLPKENAVLTP